VIGVAGVVACLDAMRSVCCLAVDKNVCTSAALRLAKAQPCADLQPAALLSPAAPASSLCCQPWTDDDPLGSAVTLYCTALGWGDQDQSRARHAGLITLNRYIQAAGKEAIHTPHPLSLSGSVSHKRPPLRRHTGQLAYFLALAVTLNCGWVDGWVTRVGWLWIGG